jgi:C4-dicarboxylate-binding protein DctP
MSGAIEMGATPLNQFAVDVPLAGAFLQPFLFNFDGLVQAATSPESEVRALVDKAILLRTKMRVLWWQPYGSSVIVSKRILPTDPSAVAGRIVGTTDKEVRDLIRVCGGLPIPASPASLFTELQNGAIEAGAADIMNVAEREMWRVADTIINLRHAPSLFVVVISESAWQRLSLEHQEILTELAQDAQSYMWARFATIRAEAYALAAQKGMRIVDVPADDVAAWRACSAPLLEEYMQSTGEAGPQLFMAYGKLRTQPCCRDAPGDEVPFFGPR